MAASPTYSGSLLRTQARGVPPPPASLKCTHAARPRVTPPFSASLLLHTRHSACCAFHCRSVCPPPLESLVRSGPDGALAPRTEPPTPPPSPRSHGAGSQVGVLVLELPVQGKTSLLPVVAEQRGDGVHLAERGAGGHLIAGERGQENEARGGGPVRSSLLPPAASAPPLAWLRLGPQVTSRSRK